MMDGMAGASRCRDSESNASFSDRTRMLRAGERIDVEPRRERLLAAGAERLEASRSPGARRPPMPAAAPSYRGREAREQPQLLSRSLKRCSVSAAAVMRSRIRWISAGSRRFSSRVRGYACCDAARDAATPAPGRSAPPRCDPDQRFDERLRHLTARDDPEP